VAAAVWAGEQIQVAATLRDTQANEVVRADFVFSVRDANLARAEKYDKNAVRITGLRRGATRLVITDGGTGVTFEVPVSVLDFPPPPN